MATDKDRYLNGAYTSRRDVRQEDIDQANDGSDW
jgi:hypothetical protein